LIRWLEEWSDATGEFVDPVTTTNHSDEMGKTNCHTHMTSLVVQKKELRRALTMVLCLGWGVIPSFDIVCIGKFRHVHFRLVRGECDGPFK